MNAKHLMSAGGLALLTVACGYSIKTSTFDAKTKQAIWRGFASDALSNNASSNAQATQQAIDKMFANFPPGSGAASGQE